jgi:hypothetical protein
LSDAGMSSVLDRMGAEFEKFTLHGFRATFKTWSSDCRATTAPALHRPAVDADQPGQPSHLPGGCALPHDGDQHHRRRKIDLATEESERRRRLARAAAVAGATEAEAPIMLLAEPGRTATGRRMAAAGRST